MAKAKVVFQKLIQDSQDYGSDDEHMVSRAFFTLEIEGNRHADMFVDIKQPVGGDFEKSLLEVSRPAGYSGPFNYEAFRAAVEKYYRSLVGSSGSGIQGGRNIRMRNNTFVQQSVAEFEISKSNAGW